LLSIVTRGEDTTGPHQDSRLLIKKMWVSACYWMYA